MYYNVALDIFRQNSEKYVRMAERGERVVIMEHERVVAELGPARRADKDVLADLAQLGLVQVAQKSDGHPPLRADNVSMPLEDILSALADDRTR